MTRVNGQWLRDDRGWWYQKGDGDLHVKRLAVYQLQVVFL